MKRLAELFLLLCMVLAALPASADDEYIGRMEVVNCNEWVSLRQRPSTSAKRLVKVSLGAIVSNCRQVNDEWIYAEYDGYSGYILAKYLQPSDGRLTFSAMMVTITDGAPFYATEGKGRNEIRIAYVLQEAKLERAMELLRLGIERYNRQ